MYDSCALQLWNWFHAPEDVEPILDKTLDDLQTNYLDLYIIHWYVIDSLSFMAGS